MSRNDFKPLAINAGANVLSQAAYEEEVSLIGDGFTSGQVRSTHINKIMRQGTVMASAVGAMIMEQGIDALDDGNVTTLKDNLKSSINLVVKSTTASAIQKQSYTAFTDTGVASAYVITPVPAITAYAANQRWQVKITNTNTGASTLNVSGLGAKAIVTPAGAATSAGDLPAGAIVDLTYNGTAYQMGSWIQSASTTQKGAAQLVSTGADATLADQSLALTAAALGTLMPRSHAGNGWQKLPGGLIIQWGSVNTNSAGAAVFTYPIALTTVLFGIAAARSGLVPIYVGSRGVIETTTTTNMAVWGNTMAGAGAIMSIDCLVIGK